MRRAIDDVRLGAVRIEGEGTWPPAREVVVQAVLARESASPGHVASISSLPLSQSKGSVTFFMPSIGSSLFSPQKNVAIVQHWSGVIKKNNCFFVVSCAGPGRACRRRERRRIDHRTRVWLHRAAASHAVAIH